MNELDKILTATCNVMQLNPVDVMARCRKRELVEARYIAIYIGKLKTKQSLNKVGSFFRTKDNPAGYDHATILHACKSVNNLIDINAELECGLRITDVIDKILTELRKSELDYVIAGNYDKQTIAKAFLGYTLSTC